MKRIALLIALLLLVVPALSAQKLNIDLPAGLADRAVETVDITLDGELLKLASKFMDNDHSSDGLAARDMVRNLQGIYVRSYEFDKEGEYDRSILGSIRSQLGPSWKKVVTVKSRDRDNVEIYVDSRNDKVVGLVILAAEPKQLTIVNLVGPIDIDRLSSLEGQFGIPKMSGKGKAQ
jgi:hypothetical protein